ncbi:GNAT family N-acetyltransferase [Nodosilinea sp. LEGE 07298]|uniref:GNAT family N-acetyltransferase n=1 Tax=Nodosilinea sp. LEGE 07298 TaxID=2777970 RepID=UPI00187F3E1B|nr:GNAT family N-acetyltransferase [Nodosilinea sp. LEGE 07298]MBE9110364.1 GNAT family N-acetyltransferase [Nodosilinea sp. LEGE 07298]
MTKHLLMSVNSRPSTGAEDLPAIAAFYEICDQVDRLDRAPSLENLQRRLDHPPPGGTQYHQLWETAQGQLVGIVALWIEDPTDVLEGWVGVSVHPDYRGAHLEAELLSWAEQQVQEQATVAQRPAKLCAGARSDASYYRAIYETANYEIIRQFHDMARSLADPIPQPQFPPGFTSRPTNADEALAWVEMFNESFIDHWNFTPMTLEDRQFRLGYPTYQPELDWVVTAPDGNLAGFCKGHVDHDENARRLRNEGWITILGTRRGYRRLGLARAMLLQGLHQLHLAGMDSVLLGVDTQNPNQATGLYESVGFTIKETYLTYQKSLS